MSARPPPPMLPLGNVSLKKTSKTKGKSKGGSRSVADIVKATLRYVKSRRMEISECDQDDDATKIA